MSTNLEIIRATYTGSSEENGRHLMAALAPEVRWTEAEGFPYAGTYVGPQAIIDGVFKRLATEWQDYKAQVHTFMKDGDRVAAFGVYSGTYGATGKFMSAAFAHLYELHEGKIISMTMPKRYATLLSTSLGFTTTNGCTRNWDICHRPFTNGRWLRNNLSRCPEIVDHYTAQSQWTPICVSGLPE